jgi:NitT/TauT family transport system substrate-binding protein
MNTADLSVQGVLSGNYDIGAAPATTVLKAIESGLPIKIIVEQMKNEFTLITPTTINKPEDLQGKTLAIHGPNTLTDALVRSTIEKYKLDKAKVLTIPGSDVRAQALMKGTIDATPADQSDVLNVQKNGGGKYHALINYAEIFPLVNGTVFFTTDKYLAENHDNVVMFTQALLENYRKVYADPTYLKQNVGKYIKNFDQPTIDQLTDIYISKKILDINGDISKESGDATIQFNTVNGLLTGNKVTFENAYDPTIIADVLTKIGKK